MHLWPGTIEAALEAEIEFVAAEADAAVQEKAA